MVTGVTLVLPVGGRLDGVQLGVLARRAPAARRGCRPRPAAAPSSTTIRSAMRTVENRCDTRIVMRPCPASCRAPRAYRSNSACSVSASSAAVGSSSTSSSGSSRMKPRASASFCHCPNETSTPSGQVGPSWVSSPAGSCVDHVVGAGPVDRRADRRLVVEPRHVAQADGVPGAELEPEEVLERAGQPRAPRRPPAIRARATPSTRIRPPRRLVQLRRAA